ncbi:MAG TPA: TIGR02147 family protein [Bacteriovoracaceae bacterium]|nr:TIGR02147 family protein [Bacteriovoracaceae bacterium]
MKQINQILKAELEKRQANNPSYSLRSFAAFLEVSPASLSQLMSGKRGVSVKRLSQLIEKLGLPTSELKSLIKTKGNRTSTVLKEDEFKLISEWYHLAILSLGELRHCRSDARWIARRLDIGMGAANEALQRLERLGMIKIEGGRFKQVAPSFTTTTDIPSGTIRTYHKAILGLAQNKLETVAVKDREYSAITMAINTKNLLKAKKLTEEYKEEMLQLLEQGSLDEVYQLSIQLFPLSIKEP